MGVVGRKMLPFSKYLKERIKQNQSILAILRTYAKKIVKHFTPSRQQKEII